MEEMIQEKKVLQEESSSFICVICFNTFPARANTCRLSKSSAGKNSFDNSETHDDGFNVEDCELDQQTPIFLLQNILELSDAHIADLESRWTDTNPWQNNQLMCQTCAKEVTQAYVIDMQIRTLSKQIEALRDKLHQEIHNTADKESMPSCQEKLSAFALIVEIRQKFRQDPENCYHSEQELEMPLRIPDLNLVKTEVEDEEHNQNLDDSYDEFFIGGANEEFEPEDTAPMGGPEDEGQWQFTESSSSSEGEADDPPYVDSEEEKPKRLRSNKRRQTGRTTTPTKKRVKNDIESNTADEYDDIENQNDELQPQSDTKKKKYKCPLCAGRFALVRTMNAHYESKHLTSFKRKRKRKTSVHGKSKGKRTPSENPDENDASNDSNDSQPTNSSAKKDPAIFTARRSIRKYQLKCQDPECLQHFPTEHFRDAHYRRRHMGIKLCFICTKCGKAYERNQGLQGHMKNCNGDGTYVYPEDPRLQEVERFKCTQCSRHYPSELAREAHVKRYHMGISKPFSCRRCKRAHKTQSAVTSHEERCLKRKGTELPADITDASDGEEPANNHKGIKSGRNASSHAMNRMRVLPIPNPSNTLTNVAEELYKCTVENCSKTFRVKEVRDGHVKMVHEGIKNPFNCSFCSNTFSKFYVLKAHEETHRTEDKQ